MAALTRVGKPSLATTLHDPGPHQIHGRAAVAFLAGDMAYLKAVSGVATLDKANGTAADALALSVGMIMVDTPAGEKATAYHDTEVRYGSGMTAGARFYLDTTAGGLSDAATTGGTVPVAFATNATNLYILPPTR